MANTPWARWVAGELERRKWTYADAHRASGVPRSAFTQWAQGTNPAVENIRRIAEAFGVPLLRALVIAEVLSADEAGQAPAAPPDLESLTADELLSEVRRRMRDPEDERKDAPRSHESPTVAYPTRAVLADPVGDYQRWLDNGGEQAR